jgi:ATP-binding cassette subfamily C protein CydC
MKTLRWLLSFLRPFAGEVLLSILIGTATIAAGIGMLGTSAFLIAMAALHPSIAELQVAIVGVRFFGISRGIFRYLERLVSHSVNLRVLSRLRVWVYEAAERIAPAGLQSERSGELLNRVMADMETLENFYVRVVAPVVVAFVVTLGMSLILGGYFLQLGLILALGMILNGVFLPALSIWMTRHSGAEMQRTRAALSADMLEMFQGLADLQAAGAEQRWLARIERSSQRGGQIQSYYGFLSGLNSGATLLVANLTLIWVLVAAIPQVRSGNLSGVSLAVVSLLTMASFEATNSLPAAAQNLTASLASARRLLALFIPAQQTEDAAAPLVDSALRAVQQVRLDDLSLRYPGSAEEALQHVSMTLTRGRVLALVGPSGAGKTSLVNLLMRFWQPQSGQIWLDGEPITNWSAESTRRLFGVISQSPTFFAETLRENLLLARPTASDAELLAALHQAELQPWLATLPEGLDTWLGEQGARLSGGEQQRLAVARVILQDTPFVILDEPTAHLDAHTEHALMTTLFRSFAGKGILLITHQLSTLHYADEILFLAQGRVVEAGDLSALLQRPGRFRTYWDLQQSPRDFVP